MKLKKAVEQAACILILLATQDHQIPLSTDEISDRLEVSPSYLKKITRRLVVKDIITSVSGNKGGISLAKDLNEISVLDVIEAVEGPIEMFKDTGLINFVFEGGKFTEKGNNILHHLFHHADKLLIDYFSTVTLADLMDEVFDSSSIPKINWNDMSLSEFLQQGKGENNEDV
ncbi:MAG TPA: Rrf2 family transcriptional regulator [Bacillota bacterium]|nr:Rrf2 family transcriptional regulator [Bacillota bacterium]